MRSRPFLLKQPSAINVRNKLREKGDDWKSAYPISTLGPIVIPWGWVLPRWILPSRKHDKQPREQPGVSASRLTRTNHLKSIVEIVSNEDCMLLGRLPLELRQAIFACVLGNDEFRLITVPWKVIAVPDMEGNVSMTSDYFATCKLRRLDDHTACLGPDAHIAIENARVGPLVSGSGTALLRTCSQIYKEAVDLLYTTNTFIVHDFHTLRTFAKSVPPQRLNLIRSLKVHWSPDTSIPYPHESIPQYDLPFYLDWFWDIVVGMRNLRNLDIYLEAYDLTPTLYDREADEVLRLEPLKRLRGLSTFRLKLCYIQDDSGIRVEPYAPAFRQELMEVAKRPRESEVLLEYEQSGNIPSPEAEVR